MNPSLPHGPHLSAVLRQGAFSEQQGRRWLWTRQAPKHKDFGAVEARAVEGSSKSDRQMSKESKVLILSNRYTIQTYPKCSVGWLVLSTAWFLCPQLLVPRKGIKPSTTASYQYLCGGFHTDLTHGSQPSVDGSSQVEWVELGGWPYQPDIFKRKIPRLRWWKYLQLAHWKIVPFQTVPWVYQSDWVLAAQSPPAISYDFLSLTHWPKATRIEATDWSMPCKLCRPKAPSKKPVCGMLLIGDELD